MQTFKELIYKLAFACTTSLRIGLMMGHKTKQVVKHQHANFHNIIL